MNIKNRMRWISFRWNILKSKIRRWFHTAACPRCNDTSWVTNEVYGNDGKQTGWEFDCDWCGLHWRIRGDKMEYLNREDMTWCEHMPKHKE